VILNAIGFPTEMFTALFALARTVGWVAQWNEMISDPEQKIGRPRQLYVGETQRDYVPVDRASRQASGRTREKRAPGVDLLSSRTTPPIDSSRRRAQPSPSPVPLESSLARSNRSKMRSSSPGEMPGPFILDRDQTLPSRRVK
jgi:hypothetical protein